MSNPTESNPALGPVLPLYNTSTGQTNIAWDVDPSTVATDSEGVTHGKAFVSGTFSSTPPAGVVSSVNSSTTPLAANGVFTGTSESILAYGSISVQAYSDVASAAGGLIIEQSQDGTNWDTKASYSVVAATPFQATVNATGQFLRTVYTNGASIQTVFRLQTIKEVNASPSAGVANQRVNAQSGDFVSGAIADLSTLPASLTELLTDTDNLATLVTNTNKIPASPAQEGGNLATIATDMAELLTDTDNLANIPAKGSAAMTGSMPVTIATNDTNFSELLTDTDHLATIDTNVATTVPGVQGWIAAAGTGTASQDDSLTFASQVRKVVLYNAAAVAVPFEFDTTSAATSIPIQPGQYMVFDDVLCTVVHVFPSALLPINTTSGLYVKGWK